MTASYQLIVQHESCVQPGAAGALSRVVAQCSRREHKMSTHNTLLESSLLNQHCVLLLALPVAVILCCERT
jgi:hypothetical protein